MNARQCGHILRFSTTGIVQSRFVRPLLLLLFVALLAFAGPQPLKTFQLPPGKYEKAVEFQRRLNALHFTRVAWELLVLGAMTAARAGPRLRDALERRVRRRFVARAITVAALFAILWAAELPLAFYRHWLGLEYGLSVNPWLPWFGDVVKSALVTGVMAVALALGGFVLVCKSPRRWWLYAWIASVLLMILSVYAAPLIFDPLFFHFQPMVKSRPDLVAALQDVAQRAGYTIPADRVFEMDASRKTRAVNAYMTGFGHSRRIVIWDTTLAALTTPQIQTVFAHELGHYALHHIARGIAFAAAGLFIVVWLGQRAARWWVGGLGRALGIRSLDDAAILPPALAFVAVLAFVSEPVSNGYSRWQEHQADIYELEAMHGLADNAGLNSADVDQIMAEIDLDDPQPGAFIRFWLYDHPPTDERMIFAQEYDPWTTGGQPKYLRN
jgi:Zn-dependent protease with chaperone function